MADEHDSDADEQERPSTAAERRQRRAGAPSSGSSSDSSADSGTGKGRATAVRDTRPKKASLFARLALFVREVVAELRKVIWPTRRQLVTYTIVVLIFVAFMVAYVAGLDWVFVQGVSFLFGA